MSDLSVKVGVRIRPLLSKERHQNNSLTNYDKQSIEFKNQTFTYDNVFGLELSQQELYQNTAAPMGLMSPSFIRYYTFLHMMEQ